MPNIRVNDYVYDKLKGFADADHRSVANATEYLLLNAMENGGTPKIRDVKIPQVDQERYVKAATDVSPTGISGLQYDSYEKLYAIVVSDTGVIVKDKLTRDKADEFMNSNNPDGDLTVMESRHANM